MKQTKIKSTLIRIQKLTGILVIILFLVSSCKKNDHVSKLRYFEVGITDQPVDWRDSCFVVATADAQMINKIEAELALPVADRKIVIGTLDEGNGGYNKNDSHYFKWHFKENDWDVVDLSIEIYDGRPYSDIDLHTAYWMDTVKRYSPWNSYIKKEIVAQ